jgi:hypothetical protein
MSGNFGERLRGIYDATYAEKDYRASATPLPMRSRATAMAPWRTMLDLMRYGQPRAARREGDSITVDCRRRC